MISPLLPPLWLLLVHFVIFLIFLFSYFSFFFTISFPSRWQFISPPHIYTNTHKGSFPNLQRNWIVPSHKLICLMSVHSDRFTIVELMSSILLYFTNLKKRKESLIRKFLSSWEWWNQLVSHCERRNTGLFPTFWPSGGWWYPREVRRVPSNGHGWHHIWPMNRAKKCIYGVLVQRRSM